MLRGIIALHRNEFDKARKLIHESRLVLDGELAALGPSSFVAGFFLTTSSLVSESYARAYGSIITSQELAEMEEIIELKTIQSRLHAISPQTEALSFSSSTPFLRPSSLSTEGAVGETEENETPSPFASTEKSSLIERRGSNFLQLSSIHQFRSHYFDVAAPNWWFWT